MSRLKTSLLTATALLLSASATRAANKIQTVNITGMPEIAYTVPAQGATIETENLSPGADTVLHVVDASTFVPIAGNDDFRPGIEVRSLVTLPPGNSRTVRIMVRSYISDVISTARVRISPGNGAPAILKDVTFGGTVVDVGGSLGANAQLQTAEPPGGAPDTVMLVVQGSDAGHAIAFDDDSGVGNMSNLRLPGGCPAPCALVAATWNNTKTGPTTIVADEDVGNGRDGDGDGLGDGVDQPGIAGTFSNAADSDGDGLLDGAEVYGIDSPFLPLKLPRWGANPIKQDVFVEVDWWNGILPSGTGDGDDTFKMTGDAAAAAAAPYLPEIAVHFDIGVPNEDPATRTLFGAWGGATRVGPFDPYADAPTFCEFREDRFKNVFRHVIATGTGGGGQTRKCSQAGWGAISHELGHQLGLQHGGGDNWNCKPNYDSLMSYAANSNNFSRGEHLGTTLNPTAINESGGFGSADATFLATGNFSLTLSGSTPPAIDWNRDGTFSTGTIRAAVLWPRDYNVPCDQQFGLAQHLSIQTGRQAAGAWLLQNQSPSQYVLVYDNNGPKQRVVTSSSMGTCALKNKGDSPDCAVFGTETAVDHAGLPAMSLAMANFNSGSNLVLLHTEGILTGMAPNQTLVPRLFAQTRTQTGPWSSAVLLDSVVSGIPSVIEGSPGHVYAFATDPGGLKAFHFVASTGTWSAGAVQKWSDGTTIDATRFASPEVTLGFRSDGVGGEQVFGLFVESSTQTMVLATWTAITNTWTKLPDSIWSDYHLAKGRPSIVYVPFDKSVPSVGRFYVHFNPNFNGVIAIVTTEGNDFSSTATTRRMLFTRNQEMNGPWSVWSDQDLIRLTYDRRADSNVRAIFNATSAAKISFSPIADGVMNLDFTDFNDVVMMRSSMSGTLAATWAP